MGCVSDKHVIFGDGSYEPVPRPVAQRHRCINMEFERTDGLGQDWRMGITLGVDGCGSLQRAAFAV